MSSGNENTIVFRCWIEVKYRYKILGVSTLVLRMMCRWLGDYWLVATQLEV